MWGGFRGACKSFLLLWKKDEHHFINIFHWSCFYSSSSLLELRLSISNNRCLLVFLFEDGDLCICPEWHFYFAIFHCGHWPTVNMQLISPLCIWNVTADERTCIRMLWISYGMHTFGHTSVSCFNKQSLWSIYFPTGCGSQTCWYTTDSCSPGPPYLAPRFRLVFHVLWAWRGGVGRIAPCSTTLRSKQTDGFGREWREEKHSNLTRRFVGWIGNTKRLAACIWQNSPLGTLLRKTWGESCIFVLCGQEESHLVSALSLL